MVLQKYQELEACPVCNNKFDAVTNMHCQKEHGMSKKEVIEQYGPIKVRNYGFKKEEEL